MDYHTISQDDREQQRLIVQRRLLSPYESPVIDKVFQGRAGLRILDVGSGLGHKAVQCFGGRKIAKLVGLEYQAEMAQQAQHTYGTNVYSFYACDVEADGFEQQMAEILRAQTIEGFDLIYLSFVLMYIRDLPKLFRRLKRLLAPGGYLMIVEPDDTICCLSPDPQGLLPAFLDILGAYPMAGDRSCGSRVLDTLRSSGFSKVSMENERVCAEPLETEKKADMFETYLSYLPEDLEMLVQDEPGNPQFAAWKTWMDTHFSELYRAVMSDEARIAMGNRILLAQ